MTIEYPITVKEITHSDQEYFRPKLLFGGECGDMVSVRPCADEYEKKTFLGVLIGEVAYCGGARFNSENQSLEIVPGSLNPMIFIPETNSVVFGYNSWWGKIESKDELKEITDETIDNVWYVKALKQLDKEYAAKGAEAMHKG